MACRHHLEIQLEGKNDSVTRIVMIKKNNHQGNSLKWPDFAKSTLYITHLHINLEQ